IETMIRQPVAMLTSIDPLHMISNGWFGQLAQMSRLDPVSESAGAALILAVLATIMLMGASMLRPDVRRLAPVRWSKRVFVVLTGGICLVIAGCAWMHGSAGIATAVDLTGGVGWAHRSASGAFYTGNGTEIRLPMRGHPMRSEDGIIRLDPLMVRSRMVIPLNVPVEAAGITVVVDRTDLHSLWHKGQALQVIVEAIEADGAQSREFFIIGTPFFGRTVRSSIPDARLIQDGVVDTGTFAQVISWQFNAPRRLDRIVFIGPDDDSTSVQILGLAFDSHQLLGTNRDCPAGEIPASVQVAPVVQLRRHTDCSVSVNLDIQNPGADRVMDLYIALSLESDRPLFYRFSSQLIRGQDNRTGIPVILEADSQYSGELLHDFVHVAPETTPADVLFAVYMTARGEPGTFLGRPGIARVRMEPVVFLDAVGKPLIAIKRESDDVSDGVLSEKQHD
ncbi:hypothetical protein JXA80_10680, partial [bacterium]|nr:hypothetical protein [candidate division CSSED10-310 bacterium]